MTSGLGGMSGAQGEAAMICGCVCVVAEVKRACLFALLFAPRFWFSSRFGLAVLGFVGFLSMSSQRTCMQVAMVCMLNQTGLGMVTGESGAIDSKRLMPTVTQRDFHNGSLPFPVNTSAPPAVWTLASFSDSNMTLNGRTPGEGEMLSQHSADGGGDKRICMGMPQWGFSMLNTSEFSYLWDGEFLWATTRQNMIFDTYSWGYIVAQVPAGWLAQRFGGKRVFGYFLLAASLSTALIPIATRTHFFILIALRFVGGVGAGATFPAMHAMWGKWAPPLERSLLASITYAGSLTGSVFIYPVAGLLCKYGMDGQGFDGGWPAIFYIFGALGLVWFLLWMVCASESPNDHKRISEDERQYIVDTLMSETTDDQPDQKNQVMHVPWSQALTSFPFAAIVLCNFTYEWGVYTFERLFPRYMKEMLRMEIQWNDWFYIMPYFGLWLLVIASGGGADRLQSHGVLSTTATRKVMQLIGAIIPASMIAAMGFIDCTKWPATISFNTIGLAFCGFQYNGFLVNHLDIAPRYAGLLMGIANAIGSTAGFLVPPLLQIVSTSAESRHEEWQTVFLISASFYVVSSSFFILCGSGRLQNWAHLDNSSIPLPLNGGRTTREKDFGDNISDDVFPHHDQDVNANADITRFLGSGGGDGTYKHQQPELTYTGDTLRRTTEDDYDATRSARSLRQQQSVGGSSGGGGQGTLPRPPGAVLGNHLTPGGGAVVGGTVDESSLNRKSSNKSTVSSRSNDSASRRDGGGGGGGSGGREGGGHSRTDHDRGDRERHRSYHGGGRDKSERGERERDRDREKDRERGDRDRGGGNRRTGSTTAASSKRASKTAPVSAHKVAPTQDDSLDIYESLSESPV